MTRKKKIEFKLTASEAGSVTVAGSFNDWDAQRTPFKKGKDGPWTAKVALPPGRHDGHLR